MQKLNFLLFSLLILLASCSSDGFEEHELGGNLIDNTTDVRLIDTFTINTATVLVDSLSTSGKSSLTVGRYVDPYLGIVRSSGYTKLGLGGAFKLKPEDDKITNPIFDSLVFITYYADNFYGDTTKTQTLSIHRVLEEIEVEDDGKLYNVKSFKFDETPLGQKSFKARPRRTEKDEDNNTIKYNFRMNLSDEWGEEIFNLAKVNSDTTSDAAHWENYLEGICLRAGDDDDAAMLNFESSTDRMLIRLFYHETSGENIDKVLHHDFPVGSSAFAFSNYQSDRTGTLLENLVEQEVELPAEETNNLTFIQGGVGLLTKVDIPYLKELAKIGLSGSLLNAQLVFYPHKPSHDKDLYPLPKDFNIYITDDKNRILNGLVNPANGNLLTSLFVDESGSIVTSVDEYEEDYHFVFDLTSYVNSVLINGEEEDSALLISLPFATLSSQMDRMVITNDKSTELEFKLKATYVVQKQ